MTVPTPRQQSALLNGATRFTVPMDPQPWADVEYVGFDNSNPPQIWGWSSDDETAEALQRLYPPYRPGARIPLSEDRYATVLSCEPCKVGEITADETVDEGMDPSTVPGIGSDSSFLKAYRAAWLDDFPGVPFESAWGWTVRVESK